MPSLFSLLALRLARLQLPALLLVALLQRTPLLRVLLGGQPAWVNGAAGQMLRSTLAVSATLGLVDTLAGATTLATAPVSPAAATVGTAFSAAFSVTGAPKPTQSYTVRGLPPGLTVTSATSAGGTFTLNAASGAIGGVPTTAGTFEATITAWEFTNGTGLSQSYDYVINVAGATALAPTISAHPLNVTVTAGQPASFSVTASGTAPLTYQWRKGTTPITGATTPTYSIAATIIDDAGNYSVVVTNTVGSVTSTPAILTVGAPVLAPTITVAPASQTIAPGGDVTFTVGVTGSAPFAYQWFKDELPISGATASTLSFLHLSGAENGDYAVTVTNAAGSATSTFGRLIVAAPVAGRIINASMRGLVPGGGNPLIVGYVVSGTPRALVTRAVGPALEPAGIVNFLPDPSLQIYQSDVQPAVLLAANDDWDDTAGTELATAFQSVGAGPLAGNAKDSAGLVTANRNISVHVRDTANRSGVTVVEVFDLEDTPASRIVNVSARNFVGAGEQVLIAGFVISGTAPKRLVIRGLGPELATAGIPGTIADPRMELHTNVVRAGLTVDRTFATNDNWGTGDTAALLAAFQQVGASVFQNTASKDAALLVEVPPGLYSVILSGVGSGTGEGMIEVFEMP